MFIPLLTPRPTFSMEQRRYFVECLPMMVYPVHVFGDATVRRWTTRWRWLWFRITLRTGGRRLWLVRSPSTSSTAPNSTSSCCMIIEEIHTFSSSPSSFLFFFFFWCARISVKPWSGGTTTTLSTDCRLIRALFGFSDMTWNHCAHTHTNTRTHAHADGAQPPKRM